VKTVFDWNMRPFSQLLFARNYKLHRHNQAVQIINESR
jgi:hypothetical protein